VAAWQAVCKLGVNQEQGTVWSLHGFPWLKSLQYHLTGEHGSNLVSGQQRMPDQMLPYCVTRAALNERS